MKKTLRSGDAQKPKARFLLIGEGPHDVGRESDLGGALAGFLTAATRGPASPVEASALPFEIESIRNWREIVRVKPPGKIPRGDAQHVAAAMLVAATMDDVDAVVIMLDCEQRKAVNRGRTLRTGRAAYRREEGGSETVGCAIAAPSRCHETWLLADTKVVQEVLGKHAVYRFSGDPEERPNADALKVHLLKAVGDDGSEHEKRIELAYRARPEELQRRCPKCYPEFLRDVKEELDV